MIKCFGPDILKKFLEREGFHYVFRAHEVVQPGILEYEHGPLWTIFSASNYPGNKNNAGLVKVFANGELEKCYIPALVNTDIKKYEELDNSRPFTPPKWVT